MLSILAFKPIVGLIFGLFLFLFFLFDPKAREYARSRSYFFISLVSGLDLLLGLIIWFKSYSKIDFSLVAVYGTLLAYLTFVNYQSGKKSDDIKNEKVEIPEIQFPTWTIPYLIQEPTGVFLWSDARRVLNTAQKKLLILAPYGSGKELLATLCAHRFSKFVLKVTRLNLNEIANRLSELNGFALILPDIQGFSSDFYEDLRKICVSPLPVFVTSAELDIVDNLNFLKDFLIEHLKPLNFEEFIECFNFFKPEDIKMCEINWDFVASLLKIIYPSQVKQIVEYSIEEMRNENDPELEKIHIAKALERFLKLTV